MASNKKAIVIGAGIVGLATAKSLVEQGYRVTVFDRNAQAQGASVRNFGMIWPIGQPRGPLLNRAFRSRQIWLDIIRACKLWHSPNGAIQLAYLPEEQAVIEEFYEQDRDQRDCQLMTAAQVVQKMGVVQSDGLRGGLFTNEEIVIDPREALVRIPIYLEEQYGVTFHWQTAINQIQDERVLSGSNSWYADQIYLCNGADFQTLFPDEYSKYPLMQCKLQMMRMASETTSWKPGPALCGGLSMVHYASFQSAPSIATLREMYEREFPEYLRWGINAMVAQNGAGELTVGDSHEYGYQLGPFDQSFLNEMVLNYLQKRVKLNDWHVTSTWHGIYAKMMNGATELIANPTPYTTIINGLGGAGMTFSFGLAEECVLGQTKPNEISKSTGDIV